MKNILIMTQKLTGGGAERVAADLSRGLSSEYNVFIVTYQKFPDEFRYDGKRIDLNLFGKNKFQKIWILMKRYFAIRKIKKQNHIDCSISFMPHVDYMNVLTKRKSEKIVMAVGNNMSIVFPSGWKNKFRSYILQKADWLVTCSQGVKDDIVANFGVNEKRVNVIYNFCDLKKDILVDTTTDAFTKSLCNKQVPKIVTAGSFRHQKAQWHLIKAFSLVVKNHPDAILIIMGDGEYRSQYEELIKKLGLQDNIRMPGFIKNPQIVMRSCDIFAFSSIYEGFGNVIIEALSCGLPVVSTDCPYGPREILAPDTQYNEFCTDIAFEMYGVITPRFENTPIDISENIIENERKFAQAIEMLLNDSELRQTYAEKGIERSEDYSIQAISTQWMRGIKILLENS